MIRDTRCVCKHRTFSAEKKQLRIGERIVMVNGILTRGNGWRSPSASGRVDLPMLFFPDQSGSS